MRERAGNKRTAVTGTFQSFSSVGRLALQAVLLLFCCIPLLLEPALSPYLLGFVSSSCWESDSVCTVTDRTEPPLHWSLQEQL